MASPGSMNWSVYMLRCGDGSLYTGVALDVRRRLLEHQSQGPKAAKYVRGRTPLTLVYCREVGTRSQALQEEWRLKRLSRARKEQVIAAGH
jgi:putative endonuclease